MIARRRFLKSLGAGAVGGSILGELLAARNAVAEEIRRLPTEHLVGTGFQQLRADYMLSDGVIYLNHASIGTVPRAVHDARVRYLQLCETNPWLYMWGGEWEDPREDVRNAAAEFLGCSPVEVTINHNTTEAFNLLANGLPLGPGDEVLFSSLNHTGASQPFFHMARSRGFTVERFQFPLLDAPQMDADRVIDEYARRISPRTRVLVFPHIDNIVGIRHPVRELAAAARLRGVDYVVVDAAQSVGMIPIDVADMGVDLFATSPHKWIQAPKGLGLAYVSPALIESLQPMWVTWGQNQWQGTARIFEDYGTRNLAEVLAMGDALAFQRKIPAANREDRLRALRQHAVERASAHQRTSWASPPSWEMNGALFGVAIRGGEANELSRTLFSEHGIVLRPFNTQGLNAVRLSPNLFNTEGEIDRFFDAL